MPCMAMCCFHLSTRLASIIVGIVTILQILIPLVLLASAGGTDYIKTMAAQIKDNIGDYDHQDIFVCLVDLLYLSPEESYLVFVVFLGVHILCCVLVIAGALKIQKYMLLPFILVDFIRLCILTLTHIIAMLVIKKMINLGDLIALTITGGFGLLLLFYSWACVVALFQIIGIVKSEKYRSLYGNGVSTDVQRAVDIRYPHKEGKIAFVQSAIKDSEPFFGYNSKFLDKYYTNGR
ncbi:uncharacterized protein LOC129780233 [Toxorhynchites rutilus septentrionalis]|uniref:uncharacterized protein LOC129780233 n=1 Tax=Toxorhynchites rutilus septentrionalis TaxID=329112 RepID=UPI00247B2A08|nr:uncharacterized protein LOC129780233 [Toxorhynchites rutilus septentrionalis]